MTKVMTANRLRDGMVVYLAWGGRWCESLADARTATRGPDETALIAAGKRAVAASLVVGPYLIDVTATGGTIQPAHYRETIRATGPSIRPDLGKQAGDRIEPRQLAHV